MFLLKVRTRLKNVRDKYRQCFFWKLVIGFNPLISLSRHFLQKPSLMGFLCHKKQSLHVHIKGGANAFRGKYFLFSPGTWNYFHSHQITHPNKNNKEKQKTSNFRINYECFRILTVKTKQCTYTWSFAHTLDLRKKNQTPLQGRGPATTNKHTAGYLFPFTSPAQYMFIPREKAGECMSKPKEGYTKYKVISTCSTLQTNEGDACFQRST